MWQKICVFKVISQDNGTVLFQIPIIHYYLQLAFFLFGTNYFVHVWLHFRWKFTRKRWVKVKLLSCLNKDDLASKRLVNNLVYLQVIISREKIHEIKNFYTECDCWTLTLGFTAWKSDKFSATYILREIIFWWFQTLINNHFDNFRCSKSWFW